MLSVTLTELAEGVRVGVPTSILGGAIRELLELPHFITWEVGS